MTQPPSDRTKVVAWGILDSTDRIRDLRYTEDPAAVRWLRSWDENFPQYAPHRVVPLVPESALVAALEDRDSMRRQRQEARAVQLDLRAERDAALAEVERLKIENSVMQGAVVRAAERQLVADAELAAERSRRETSEPIYEGEKYVSHAEMFQQNDPIIWKLPAPPEFTDVERFGAYINSKQARVAMTQLAEKYGLTFYHNPGGGEFVRKNFRCQIGHCDDVADYNKLAAAVLTLPDPSV